VSVTVITELGNLAASTLRDTNFRTLAPASAQQKWCDRREPSGNARMKGKTTAADLGIDLASKKEEELFKWLLACLLFGKPIQTSIAAQAYRTIVAAHLCSPDAIIRAGWDELVRLLDEAHYVRYDFSTATKLLEISDELKHRYGNVTNLIAEAKTPRELSVKLQEFKNVGPVTARIFLREMRPYWRSSRTAGKKREST